MADDDGFDDGVRQGPDLAQQLVCRRVVEPFLDDDVGRAEPGKDAIEGLGGPYGRRAEHELWANLLRVEPEGKSFRRFSASR